MWDYLYSADAARAFRMLGESGIGGKTYVVGSGKARPLKEYMEMIRDTVCPDARLAFGTVPYAEKQVMHLCADISDLEKDTGWKPVVDFPDGIKEILKEK